LVAEPPIACPFCGLGCDDLAVEGDRVETRGCGKAAGEFARGGAAALPHRVKGAPADLATAAKAAGAILMAARVPLFCGLAADLHGIRALLALAERAGGVLDHRHGAALLANAAIARTSGWVTASFGEIANRAEIILLVGSDPAARFPRFHERLVENARPLYRSGPPLLASLGPATAAPLQAIVEPGELLPALAQLALLLRGGPVPADPSPLAEIARRLREARYGAIVWDASAFETGEAEYAVELIAAMLRHLNIQTRCVGLPLGSGDGVGAMQAALWQAGWPPPLGFGDGVPRHDPWRHDARRMLAAGEADAVLWVAALDAEAPPATAAPLIALVADDVALPAPAAVELRVGIPGIDHGGAIFRADGVVALKLRAARPSARTSVAEAAGAILAAMGSLPC